MIPSAIFILCFLGGHSFSLESTFQNSTQKVETEWLLSDLVSDNSGKVRISDHPQIIKCKYGKALLFNGTSDGVYIDSLPMKGFQNFTIEAIIRPDGEGSFEQRFFHCGEVKGDRVLMETRTLNTQWYFDAFIKSSDNVKVLADSTLLHPLNQWYHVAVVVDTNRVTTYVNRIKELSFNISVIPITIGKTSIGVRLNEMSWFKGAIYKIKISSKAMNPQEFMNY